MTKNDSIVDVIYVKIRGVHMLFKRDLVVNETVNIQTNSNISKKVFAFFKGLINSKTLPYIVMLFLIAPVEIIGLKPFAVVLLGTATIFNIPLMIPLVVTLFSLLIFKADISIFINYIATYIIYTVLTSIIEIEGFSKKYITLMKLAISTLLANLVTCLVFKNLLIDGIAHSLLVLVFYPVFTSGMTMLLNITKKIVFSKEEIISLGVIVTIACMPFVPLKIFGFSIVNVLLIAMIVTLGWKNDWMVGVSAGVIIGLVYAIATGSNTLIITSFVFSGLIAGILSRYNKWVVVIAFVIGNIVLSYLYGKDVNMFIRLAEILIASGIIVALPRKLIIKLEDMFGSFQGLGRGYENLLGAGAETRDRLNAMSEVFDNLAHITTPVTEETISETAEVIKKYLLDYKKNECISCPGKFACMNEEIDLVAEHIANNLENGSYISTEMLPIDCDKKEELLANIRDIYSNMKLMRIVKQKENETSTKLAEEYKAISGFIRNIAREESTDIRQDTPEQKRIREELKYMGYIVYEDSFVRNENDVAYEFITDILIDINKAKKEIQKIVSDIVGTKMTIKLVLNSSKTERSRIKLIPTSKYVVKATVKQVRKADSSVSGDSYIVTELKDNNKVIAISDGMGSGPKSKEISASVIDMIEKMGINGFSNEETLEIVNRLIKLKENGEVSATLDMCVLNEKQNILEFIKLGAVSSYVIYESSVDEIKQDTMPIGLLSSVQHTIIEKPVEKGMYIILMSDGATSDVNKDELEKIVGKLAGTQYSEKDLMNAIMENIVGNQNKITLDDVTVIVCKIV